jgi:hypothetical protein
MSLKAIHESLDNIPEQYRDLYSERDGKFELTGIDGVKTQADVDRVMEAHRKEKAEHVATKSKLKAFTALEIDPDQYTQDQDELKELRVRVEQGGNGKVDEEKLEKLVEARVATKTAPLERELRKLSEENKTLTDENGNFKRENLVRTITDATRTAATSLKVIDSAQDDVLMLAERVMEVLDDGTVVTKDGMGVTPGIAPDVWLQEMQSKRPHWWPPSQGGGAGGGNGSGIPGLAKNPWTADNWNLTAQGQVVREHGSEKAMQIAKLAGSALGATHPPAAKK